MFKDMYKVRYLQIIFLKCQKTQIYLISWFNCRFSNDFLFISSPERNHCNTLRMFTSWVVSDLRTGVQSTTPKAARCFLYWEEGNVWHPSPGQWGLSTAMTRTGPGPGGRRSCPVLWRRRRWSGPPSLSSPTSASTRASSRQKLDWPGGGRSVMADNFKFWHLLTFCVQINRYRLLRTL